MSELFCRGFGSDNHAPIHPAIFQSLSKVNQHHSPSYGTDPITHAAVLEFQKHFGSQTQVHFVFNGTAANVLSLRTLTQGFESVLCSDVSHIHVDECAAPEAGAHVKLLALPSTDGRLQLADLKKALVRRGDQHFSQIRVVSLTQPTELGTTYSLEELRTIIEWAHSQELFVHIDGARLANAVVSLNTNFHELCTHLHVDVVSFGGTKNGLMMGEAVLILNPKLGAHFKYFRKQLGQLPSKGRFLAAQFLAYFENDLWKEMATHSLQAAQHLREAVSGIPGVKITRPTQSNAVFAQVPAAWVKKLREKYFFYVWDEATFECRWMTSWDTQTEEILGFAQYLKELAR